MLTRTRPCTSSDSAGNHFAAIDTFDRIIKVSGLHDESTIYVLGDNREGHGSQRRMFSSRLNSDHAASLFKAIGCVSLSSIEN